jgi:hypothetical protein
MCRTKGHGELKWHRKKWPWSVLRQLYGVCQIKLRKGFEPWVPNDSHYTRHYSVGRCKGLVMRSGRSVSVALRLRAHGQTLYKQHLFGLIPAHMLQYDMNASVAMDRGSKCRRCQHPHLLRVQWHFCTTRSAHRSKLHSLTIVPNYTLYALFQTTLSAHRSKRL